MLRGLRHRLRTRREGRLFLLGLAGGAALVLEMLFLAWFRPAFAGALARMVAVEIVGGREAAIPLGLAEGTPPWLVAQVSAMQDLVAVALVFPVFLYALDRYRDRDNLLMRRLRRIDEAAERHRHLADRFGALGLFAFMLVPFLVNGPLVGAVLGRLAGMRLAAVVWPVVGATVAAAFAWSYFYSGMQALFPDLDPRWAIAVTAIVILVGLGVSFILDRRERAGRRREG